MGALLGHGCASREGVQLSANCALNSELRTTPSYRVKFNRGLACLYASHRNLAVQYDLSRSMSLLGSHLPVLDRPTMPNIPYCSAFTVQTEGSIVYS